MSEILENEQWLSDADCDKCRRQKYCKRDCTQKRRKQRAEEMKKQRQMYEALQKALAEQLKKQREETAAPVYQDEDVTVE